MYQLSCKDFYTLKTIKTPEYSKILDVYVYFAFSGSRICIEPLNAMQVPLSLPNSIGTALLNSLRFIVQSIGRNIYT